MHGRHAQGLNKGTMRAPNNRKREDLLARSLAKAASSMTSSSPIPSTGHGGFPTPTPAPATYAAAASSSPKPKTMLEDKLGELASNYKLSSETIEEAQLRFLNFFLDGIESRHLSDLWRKCARSATSPARSLSSSSSRT